MAHDIERLKKIFAPDAGDKNPSIHELNADYRKNRTDTPADVADALGQNLPPKIMASGAAKTLIARNAATAKAKSKKDGK